mmetsp:Transcript_12209/g.21615  ORF Transcript_12209/g.21615 Transcript_12209/m.21615 type:complete len:127 (+) Transcript_12209:191-571(+)|eukprot:CAMPEP_0119109596 /NCGR_PEP_ID=MMETSP1180-20130426/20937_1 /TAXON_ID=3052 ORGANISM="Chlamydomonas cf sp, Strain CCMP681" /NCGR_SAMPLE_ID=MMETSP1180 /ASSEMBLY_ACC=CAM_ASM_000741 /LENGTH=126 /DNA_ID=CAMNT_0007095443 /DNA_START=124 /DNA_END=504 /DNA_ORIENTATION=-
MVEYRGAEGGLLGAYSRVKARHQEKHRDNPNPKRPRVIRHHHPQAQAVPVLQGDALSTQDLTVLCTEMNGEFPLSEADIWGIMLQCKLDSTGRLPMAELPKALAIYKKQSRVKVPPGSTAKCCTIS